MELNNTLQDRGVLAAVAIAHGVSVEQSSASFQAQVAELVEQRKDQEFPAAIKDAVRNLLKTGGFKPSGRNKPASEYLAQAAREGRFPFINNLVDINNFLSLGSGLPISLLDADQFGSSVLLRFGNEGERYVFNSAGQEIDLNGLICACCGDTDKPLGNAVKDSMDGKIKEMTKSVVAIIYAPATGDLSQVAKTQIEEFAELLRSEGHATDVKTLVG
ncbi:MAG: phenylalanine--tRNA ligase beta subunit-related protein [Candidatus Melainabacteria bacterium]|nr:phenylalanine--tRNA ligase beta subunit-related protein [Candidatus Melainabacteria bacterium]